MPTTSRLPLIDYAEKRFERKDYVAQFSEELDQSRVHRLLNLFQLARFIPHPRGEAPVLTLDRLKVMIARLNNPELVSIHSHNPIKGFLGYDYPKGSEEYAFLNVIGKKFFRAYAEPPFKEADRTPLRIGKLQRLHREFGFRRDNIASHIWKILNCFSGADLARLIPDPISSAFVETSLMREGTGIPQLKPEILDHIWETIERRLTAAAEIEVKHSHVEKRKRALALLLKESRVVRLEGPPGVGKTFSLEELPSDQYVIYQDEEAWKKDTSDKTCILLRDEYNMSLPGTFEHFNHLKVSDRHKILAIGNPRSFTGRHKHAFFERYERIHMRMPEDAHLDKTLQNLLPGTTADAKRERRHVIAAFHLAARHHPTHYYSSRDLLNAARRFVELINDVKDTDSRQQKLYRALAVEFSGTMPRNKREAFLEVLGRELGAALDKKTEES